MDTMGKVRFGILGCANIANKYIAAAILQVSAGELVAIASRDINKSKEFTQRFHCEYEESYDSLLRRKDIGAVYIPLPVGLHQEWVIKAAKAGKHILCEKSLAESYDAVKEMVSVCDTAGVHLFENFMCDYHPQHERVISLIQNGEIGKTVLFQGMFGCPPLDAKNIRYSKSLGGGALNDMGTYPLFMSRKLFAAEPEAVTCRLDIKKKERDSDNEVDLEGNALLEFSNGKTAFISFGFNNFYQNNYSIWGEKGLIRVNRAYSIPPDMKPDVELQKQGVSQRINVDAANHFVLLISAFCEVIGSDMKPDYSSLLLQARAMEALRVSAREGRKVRLSEIE